MSLLKLCTRFNIGLSDYNDIKQLNHEDIKKALKSDLPIIFSLDDFVVSMSKNHIYLIPNLNDIPTWHLNLISPSIMRSYYDEYNILNEYNDIYLDKHISIGFNKGQYHIGITEYDDDDYHCDIDMSDSNHTSMLKYSILQEKLYIKVEGTKSEYEMVTFKRFKQLFTLGSIIIEYPSNEDFKTRYFSINPNGVMSFYDYDNVKNKNEFIITISNISDE